MRRHSRHAPAAANLVPRPVRGDRPLTSGRAARRGGVHCAQLYRGAAAESFNPLSTPETASEVDNTPRLRAAAAASRSIAIDSALRRYEPLSSERRADPKSMAARVFFSNVLFTRSLFPSRTYLARVLY